MAKNCVQRLGENEQVENSRFYEQKYPLRGPQIHKQDVEFRSCFSSHLRNCEILKCEGKTPIQFSVLVLC